MTQQHTDDPGAPKPHSVTIEGEAFPSAPKHIEYLPVETPAPGEFVQVAPSILWLRIPMPMDLNHINLWLLDEGDGYTLVDTGINADMAKAAWESIATKAFAIKPLKRIFLTHLHPDHIGLATWLQEKYRVPAWMSARGLGLVNAFAGSVSNADANAAQSFMMSHGFTDTEMLGKFFSGRNFRSGISGIPDVSYQPVDGEHLALGGSSWQVFETNGHAEGHQCLFDAARNILISGDQVLPTISPNVSYSPRGGDTNPLNSFLASLERLSALDRHTLVLPSHGRPFYGLAARAKDLIAHHREHLQAVQDACAVPKTAYDLVPVMFKRRLIGSHWMFAMGETIAHAEYLALAGKLARHIDGEGMIRYVRTL